MGQLGLAGGAERAGPVLPLQGGPKWGKMEGSHFPGSLSHSLNRTKLLQPLLLLQTSYETTIQYSNCNAIKVISGQLAESAKTIKFHICGSFPHCHNLATIIIHAQNFSYFKIIFP